MAERAALLIAVEAFFEAGPPLPYAATDWNELARALPAAGYRSEKCLQISGHRTTKAALESQLRRLPKLVGKVDSLLVAIATRGFSHKDRGYLVCADTLPADPLETSFPVVELLSALTRTRCQEIVMLLDIDPLVLSVGLASRLDPGLRVSELTKLFDESTSCVGLLSDRKSTRLNSSHRT